MTQGPPRTALHTFPLTQVEAAVLLDLTRDTTRETMFDTVAAFASGKKNTLKVMYTEDDLVGTNGRLLFDSVVEGLGEVEQRCLDGAGRGVHVVGVLNAHVLICEGGEEKRSSSSSQM